MKKNVLGIAAAVLPALFCSGLLASCVSTNVDYANSGDEMVIQQDSSLLEKTFAPEEIKKWNVLVLDTENTSRTEKMLGELHTFFVKQLGADDRIRADTNYETIHAKLNKSLEKCFNKVSYEGVSSESYDLILLRDFQAVPGSKSGKTTTVQLTYYFVYATVGTEYEGGCQFLYRGGLISEGSGVLPYPPSSYRLHDSVDAALGVFEESFSTEGLTLCCSDAISLPQQFTGVASTSWVPAENPGQKSRLVSDDGTVSVDLLRKKLQRQK